MELQGHEKGDSSWSQMLEITEGFISGMSRRWVGDDGGKANAHMEWRLDRACGLLRPTHNRHRSSSRPPRLRTVRNWGRTHNNTIRITGAMVNGRIRNNQGPRRKRSVPDRPGVGPNHRIRRPGSRRSGVVERIRYPRPMAKRRSGDHERGITKLSSIIRIPHPTMCRCPRSKCPSRTTDWAPRDLARVGPRFSTAPFTRGRRQMTISDRLPCPDRNMIGCGLFRPAWSRARCYRADTLMHRRSHTRCGSLP